MALTIIELTSELCPAWDHFVSQHPDGSPFHLIAWKKSIEETFRYRPLYTLAMEDGRIQGILPLFLTRSLVIGKALISSPFAVYGGALAQSEQARHALYEHACALGQQHQVQYVEFRNSSPAQRVGEPNVSRYVSFSQPVVADEEQLLSSLPKKTRNMVRKAMKHPFTTRRQDSDYRAFEALYASNMRRLGTPSFPARHFEALLRNFGKMVDIREVLLGDKLVAASFNFYFRDQMHTYYAASDPKYNDVAPNNYMYFDHLQWAGKNGYSTFDFGRCKKGTGVFEFKRHWGSTMRELPYEVVLVKRKKLPNFSPANKDFQMAIALWKNLPLPLTRALGPQLVRLFP